MMNWHVLGVGAIGGLWASSLAQAQYPVTLLLRDRRALDEFRAAPLRLETDSGQLRPALDAVAVDALERTIEWLLVTTKSYATLDALAAVEARLSPDCRILLLQNGMGIHARVARRHARAQVIAGVTTDAAYRRSRFHVVRAGKGRTLFGAVSRVSGDSVASLRRCMERVTLDAEWVDEIEPFAWHKLAVNACINPLSAIRGCRNGALLNDAQSLETIRGLVLEVGEVIRAAGVAAPQPDLYRQVVDVIEATAENYSSMCQDLAGGRPTEIESINGYVCAQGRRLGVATPLNRMLRDAVLAKSVEA